MAKFIFLIFSKLATLIQIIYVERETKIDIVVRRSVVALNAMKYLKIWLKFLRLLRRSSFSFLILIRVKIDSVKYKSEDSYPPMRKNGKGKNIRSGVSDLDGFVGCIMASRAILLLVLEKMLVMFGYFYTLEVTEGHIATRDPYIRLMLQESLKFVGWGLSKVWK